MTYLTWTEDNLLRQVSYQGQREDKRNRSCARHWCAPHRVYCLTGIFQQERGCTSIGGTKPNSN